MSGKHEFDWQCLSTYEESMSMSLCPIAAKGDHGATGPRVCEATLTSLRSTSVYHTTQHLTIARILRRKADRCCLNRTQT